MTFHRWAVAARAIGPLLILLPYAATTAVADDYEDAVALYRSGHYEACIEAAQQAIDESTWIENWRLLKIDAELAIGRYQDALRSLEEALGRHPSSIRLRWIGRRVYQFNQRPELAAAMFDQIAALVQRTPWRYTDGASRVALGRYLLATGNDARQVLELIYDRVKKDQPPLVDSFIASGDLALEKKDFAMAADEFRRALERSPDDPDLHFKLARALAESDAEGATKSLAQALELNPRHVDGLLFQVDHAIDSEHYDEAAKLLDRVQDIHPRHPQMWAYRAVLAHLASDQELEACARYTALSHWPTNPEVDHLIGKKLSQKYRFAEGAAYQRRALRFDPSELSAKLQLSQDLLRLGAEPEGWQLAGEVYEADNYNVLAFNLVTLHDHLAKFRTLDDGDFIVRMDAREAAVYGDRVLALLHRAKQTLCEKYEVTIDEPVVVEIFPEQKDFAIRTFGLPGGAGFLGVCFGKVITANSPASQGDQPANWESVLWHEFCHVVTLQKTHNKMPRWLSEGISVYEELQANPAWGQSLNPAYRQMILEGELTPVSQLSGAFLQPPSPRHLQFAYFESALVVEYLVDRYGIETLRRILVDLSVGMPINQSLARYAGSLAALDAEFSDFAMERAQSLAPQLDWTEPGLPDRPDERLLREWGEQHPNNFWVLRLQAQRHIDDRQWQPAKRPLERLIELYPQFVESGNAYELLAEVHRELGETPQEREVLEQWAARSADAVDAYLRLMELARAAEDWETLAVNAERLAAVNPLLRQTQQALADSASKLGRTAEAISAYHALLALEPLDLAGTHFQLARLLADGEQFAESRRHVLLALEEAPRYRDAHRLLLELHRRGRSAATPGSASTNQPADLEEEIDEP